MPPVIGKGKIPHSEPGTVRLCERIMPHKNDYALAISAEIRIHKCKNGFKSIHTLQFLRTHKTLNRYFAAGWTVFCYTRKVDPIEGAVQSWVKLSAVFF